MATQKCGTEENLAECAKQLIRDDILDYVREIHPLWKWQPESCEHKDVLQEAATALADTYFLSTKGSQIICLYRLALIARQAVQIPKRENTDFGVEVMEDACLRRLYGEHWTQIATKGQRRIQKEFGSNIYAGSILVKLVATFGSGILLTCTPKVHQM